MNKKIKVIELLNKIAKGEKVPKKIKILGNVFEWFGDSYRKEDANLEYIADYVSLDCILNDEIDILEDNTEEIEEIEELDLIKKENIWDKLSMCEDKINELVKRINYIERKTNEN